MHEGMRRLVADLNAAYRSLPALHERDCEPDGFEWLIGNDQTNSVTAWLRKAPDADPVLVLTNFTPVPRSGYKVPVPLAGRWVDASIQMPAGMPAAIPAIRWRRCQGGRGAALAGRDRALPAAPGDPVSQIRAA